MLLLLGLGVVLACVFGSFVASGGAIGPLLASMPFELLTILGAAIGAYIMANSLSDLKHLASGLKLAMKGPRFKRSDYVDLLHLLYQLTKLMHAKGIVALEPHIERPEESEIFKAFPLVLDNVPARAMICDYFRIMTMDLEDPNQVEEIFTRELKKNLHEELHLPHSLQTMSDGLPALGIVAAVLGVIKTMSSISKPPIVLGEMIAGALVGTFLGVLLAYGIVAPIAARLTGVIEADASYNRLIRSVLVAHLQGNVPQVSVEIGRKEIPSLLMPTFQELENVMLGVVVES